MTRNTSTSFRRGLSTASHAPRPSLSTAMSGNSVSFAIAMQSSSSFLLALRHRGYHRTLLSSSDKRRADSHSMNAFFLSNSTPRFRSSFVLRKAQVFDLLGQMSFLTFEFSAVSQSVTSLFQGLYLRDTFCLQHLVLPWQRWRLSWRARVSTSFQSYRQRTPLRGRFHVLSLFLRGLRPDCRESSWESCFAFHTVHSASDQTPDLSFSIDFLDTTVHHRHHCTTA